MDDYTFRRKTSTDYNTYSKGLKFPNEGYEKAQMLASSISSAARLRRILISFPETTATSPVATRIARQPSQSVAVAVSYYGLFQPSFQLLLADFYFSSRLNRVCYHKTLASSTSHGIVNCAMAPDARMSSFGFMTSCKHTLCLDNIAEILLCLRDTLSCCSTSP